MSDLEVTQSKLRSTPTAGVAGEHSAYYRRLLSAGYKGYIQGMIGGATLYGALGLAVGALVAAPVFLLAGPLGITASAAWMIIPALGGLGVMHGAHTFADIGKTAAIIAESADTNEKRRYLLDRYYETPDDHEATAIRTLLQDQMKPKVPEKMFHWKTVLIGAALGLAFTAGFMLLSTAFPEFALAHLLEHIGLGVATHSAALIGIGTAIGTAAGAMIGLDREYVRRWLDHAEVAVHDQTHVEQQIAERAREVSQLGEVGIRNLRRHTENAAVTAHAPIAPNLARPDPVPPAAIAGTQPSPVVNAPELQDRVAIQHAMQTPVL